MCNMSQSAFTRIILTIIVFVLRYVMPRTCVRVAYALRMLLQANGEHTDRLGDFVDNSLIEPFEARGTSSHVFCKRSDWSEIEIAQR